MTDLIEPTEDEKRNGWTAESLTAYVRAQEKASLDRANGFDREPVKPQTTVRKSPFRWRR
jgi:hypothetical protein